MFNGAVNVTRVILRVLPSLQASKDEALAESASKSEEIVRLEATLQQQLAAIAEYEARRRQDETMRRKLHNTIQELKGQ